MQDRHMMMAEPDRPFPPQEPTPIHNPPDLSKVPFPLSDNDSAWAAMQRFAAEHPCAFGFRRTETGLPSFVYGKLMPLQGSPLETATTFVHDQAMMLAGLPPDDLGYAAEGESGWDEGQHQVDFSQVNSRGIPVYGGRVVCSFDPDQLALVTSTLYPASLARLNDLAWADPLWLHGSPAQLNLPDDIKPVAFVPPPNLRDNQPDLPDHPSDPRKLADSWILPYRDLESGEGVYRPAWRTVVIDEKGLGWLILVDARDPKKPEILICTPTRVRAEVTARVFETVEAAINPALSTIVKLDYGLGNNTLANASHVRLTGPRFTGPPVAEPPVPPVPLVGNPPAPPAGALTTNRLLSANVFHHLRQCQKLFAGLLNGLDIFWFFSCTGAVNPTSHIDVRLLADTGDAWYDLAQRAILLYSGTDAPVRPIAEPGFDREVLYHEFAHAVNHYLRPCVFNLNDNETQCLYTGSLDEGLGFYYGVTSGANLQWADFAYGAWNDVRTLSTGALQLDAVLGALGVTLDPVSSEHGLGIWWASLFSALKSGPEVGAGCDRLLLKAFRKLAGPIDFPSPFGAALHHAASTQLQKNAIVSAFAQFGVDLTM